MSNPALGGADVVVIGAGPAGMAAAATAAERGRRVMLLDQAPLVGGQIWRHRDEASVPAAARTLIARVRTAGVVVVTGAQVIDAEWPGALFVSVRGRIHRVRAGAVVLATGARERFVPFPGWTLPGVVGVGGLQALLKTGLLLRDKRVVIAGTGPLLFPVAAAAVQAGADVRLVVEQARAGRVAGFAMGLIAKPSAIALAWHYRRAFAHVPFRLGAWVTAAYGDGRVQEIGVSIGGRVTRVACDWAAVSGGLVPNTEFAELLGCTCSDDAISVDARQQTTVADIFAAGECTGVKGDAAAMVEGEIAGCGAAGDGNAAVSRSRQRRRRAGRAFGAALAHAFAVREELRELATGETIICRCENVRRGDLDLSWTQRQAKLWTRVGMGECQGAVCGPICHALFAWGRNAPRPPLGLPHCGDWSESLQHQSGDATAATATDSSR